MHFAGAPAGLAPSIGAASSITTTCRDAATGGATEGREFAALAPALLAPVRVEVILHSPEQDDAPRHAPRLPTSKPRRTCTEPCGRHVGYVNPADDLSGLKALVWPHPPVR